jgi:nucleotide-binding universal stress UspA family protein
MTASHILVPTDFSEYADYALDYAIELAQKLQARLTLLHIIDTMPLGVVEEGSMLPPSYWLELETSLEQSMEASLKRLDDVGLQGETLIIHGVPFQSIIDTAKDKEADLIVMGTHGRTGLTHVLMGSVAERVVRMAPCPVLVTRGKTETSDA